MTIDFYYTPGSPPCRAVLLTAKALGLEMNLKQLDLHQGEHLKPEFVKVRYVHDSAVDRGFLIALRAPCD